MASLAVWGLFSWKQGTPFGPMQDDKRKFDEDLGSGLTLKSRLCRLKAENDLKQMFSNIYSGPITNIGKVRLN